MFDHQIPMDSHRFPSDSHQNHGDKMGYKMGYSYTQISWIPVDGRGRSTGRSYASQRGRDPNVEVETAGQSDVRFESHHWNDVELLNDVKDIGGQICSITIDM